MMLALALLIFATILLETKAAFTPLILSSYRPRHVVLEEDQYDPVSDGYETPRGVASHREDYRAKAKPPHQVSTEYSNFASDEQQYRSLVNLLNGLKHAYLVRQGESVRIYRISNPDVLQEYRERHSVDGSIGDQASGRACQCGLDGDQDLDGVGFKERLRLMREGRSDCNCKENVLDLTLRSLLSADRRAYEQFRTNEESVRHKSDRHKDNRDFATAIGDDTLLPKNRNDRDEKDSEDGRHSRDGRDIDGRDVRDGRDVHDERDVRHGRDIRDGRDVRHGRDVRDGRNVKEGRGIREGRHERAHAYKDYKDSVLKLDKADEVDKKSNANKGTNIGWDYDAAPKKAKDRFDDFDEPKKPKQNFNNFDAPKKIRQKSDNFDSPKKSKQTSDTFGAPKKVKPLEKSPRKFSPTTMDWRELVKQEKAKNSRSHFNVEPVLPYKGTGSEWGSYKNLKLPANDEWAKVGVESAPKPVRPQPIRYRSAENARSQRGGSYGGGGFGRTSVPLPGKKRLYDDEN